MDKQSWYKSCFLRNSTPKFFLDPATFTILETNYSGAELFERSREQLIGMNFCELAVADAELMCTNLKKAATETQHFFYFELCVAAQSKRIEVYSSLFPDGEEQILSLALVDATRRASNETLLCTIMREAQMGIVIARAADGIIIDCNETMARMLERPREEIIGQPQAFLHPEAPEESGLSADFIQHRDSRTNNIIQKQIIAKSGKLIDVEIKPKRFTVDGQDVMLGFFQDITTRLELESQLRQRYKMEAVGVMAAGIAHNFNNSLGIIMNSIDMINLNLDEPDKVEKLLSNAKIGALRIRDLVQQILTYTRGGKQQTEAVQLGIVIDETTNLLRATIPNSIDIRTNIDVEDPRLIINADAGKVQEALLNLCANAVKAMDEKGTLTISTDKIDLTSAETEQLLGCQPGPHARLRVQDTGCGIPPQIIDKIFDPFYSSHGQSHNQGMGLSTVLGTVRHHHGCIQVTSEEGRGSCFDLFFPLVASETPEIPQDKNLELPGGTENVLFVDDEEILVDMGVMMLEELGYNVTGMTSSSEALRLFRANPHHFDLVITDQSMPDLTGIELVEQLHAIRPEIPTIVCTGYSSKINHNNAADLGIEDFMLKPLEMELLAHKIRRVLDS